MELTSKIFRRLYWPMCRAYARFVTKDKPAGLVHRAMCVPVFWTINRYWPSFLNPQRFSEKLWHRMLLDRDPRLTMIMDKLRVRDYVASKVGPEHLIPLLWSGTDPEKIPFHDLPEKFVIKANHGCGYNIIVKDKARLDIEKTRRQLTDWLNENFCLDRFIGIEWGYKNIRPAIIVESFIGEDGKEPIDYKFWCFSGRVDLVIIHIDRFSRHHCRPVNRNWEPQELGVHLEDLHGKIFRPDNYEEMIRIADTLSENFRFMRIDLYCVDNRIYFGEFTPYPAGIESNIFPSGNDWAFGKKWREG